MKRSLIVLIVSIGFNCFSQAVNGKYHFKPYEAPMPQDIFETLRGVISPDGTQLVYGSYQTGDNSVRFKLFNIATKKINNLTKSAGFRRNPAWSPDGKNIVFVDIIEGRKGLWILNIKTLQETQIYKVINESVTTPEWRKDNTIVFTKFSKESTDFVSINSDNPSLKTVITNLPKGSKYASLSHSGNKLAYCLSENVRQKLYVMSIIDGKKMPLMDSLYILPERPVWSFDDKKLYFSATKNVDSCLRLMEYNFDSKTIKSINKNDGDVMRISQLSNGKLAFTTYDPILTVGVLPADGGSPKAILSKPIHDELMPSWSANGMELFYMQGDWRQVQMIITNDLKWDIYKSSFDNKNYESTDSKLVINEDGEDYGPCISPNNKWIAFHGHRNNTDDIYIKRNTTAIDSIITISTGGHETGDPAWSANGGKLIFTSTIEGDYNRPYIVNIDDITGFAINKPKLVNLQNFEGHAYSSRFSPNGKFIAFCGRMKDNSAGVFTVPVEGGKPNLILKYQSGEPYGFAEWSKDGYSLYYASNENGGVFSIKKVELLSKKITQITRGNINAVHPRLSPDGKNLAVTLWNPNVKLWIQD